jgi:hypothetical protein
MDQLLMYQHMTAPPASGGTGLMPLQQQLGGLSLGHQPLPATATGAIHYGMGQPGMLQQAAAMPEGMMVGASGQLAPPSTAAMQAALGAAGLPMGDGSQVTMQGLPW